MNLEELGNLYENAVFQKRVAVALVKAGNAILFEDVATVNHEKTP